MFERRPLPHRPSARGVDAVTFAPTLGPRKTGAGRSIEGKPAFAPLASALAIAFVLTGCASSSDRQDPLRAELESVRTQQASRGAVQCRPGTSGSCFTGPKEAGGRGICKEGVHQCGEDGYWGSCKGEVMPKARELCNGLDDDCNGVIDDGFPRIGSPCDEGQGECKVSGVYVCRADGTHADCSVRARAPAAEVCDGKDNDCNGTVDDPQIVNSGKPCDTGKPGACKRGHEICVAAEIHCIPDTDARHEVCNKIDDDCDGTIDEACVPEK